MRLTKTLPSTTVLGGFLAVGIAGLAANPPALAQGSCQAQGGSRAAACDMSGKVGSASQQGCGATPEVAASGPNSASRHVFMKPAQSVFDGYMKVQQALARDSLEPIAETAGHMAKVIRDDALRRLEPEIAEQAEALAQAKDLESARRAFKPLSESLVAYLKAHQVPPGKYSIAYCPMVKASWIQTDTTILNPYMGKKMVHCGQLKS